MLMLILVALASSKEREDQMLAPLRERTLSLEVQLLLTSKVPPREKFVVTQHVGAHMNKT